MTAPRRRPPGRAAAFLAAALFAAVLALPPPASALDSSHMKPSEDELIARGYRPAGEKAEDKFPEIPGSETLIRIYRKGQETIGLYILPNGLVYGYAVKTGSQPITAYIDEYNTGYCEKDLGDGESFTIDLRAYRMAPGAPARKGLPR
jgi:hypothetical protein